MIAGVLSAQNIKPNVVVPPALEAPTHEGSILDRTPIGPSAVERGGGGLIFFEDFEMGFDGNNGFGAWTVDDTSGEDIWNIGDADGPQGEWSTNVDPIDTENPDNSYALFECDEYNTQFAGATEGSTEGDENYQDVEGTLTSPTLSFAGIGAVVVSWTQYYRFCCSDEHPYRLEVSGDGGDSWDTYDAGGLIPSDTNDAFGPTVVSVDVSCTAGNADEVIFRWAFRQPEGGGSTHYYWGIDDVSIFENETGNDLTIGSYVSYTDYNFTGIYEYGVWPYSQLTELQMAADYQVLGTTPQPNSILTVTAGDYSESSDPQLLEYPTCVGDTLKTFNYTPPAVEADYTATFVLSSDSTDANPEDNTRTQNFSVSEFSYGRDDGTFSGVFPADGTQEFIAASSYQIFEETTVYAIDVALMNGSEGGADIVAYLLDADLAITAETDEITVNPEFLNSTNATTILWHTLVLTEPITLNVNEFVAAGFNHFGGTEVQIGESKNVPAQTCFVNGDFGTAGFDWYFTTEAPMVRLNFDPNAVNTPQSTSDLEDQDGNKLFQNTPNPTTDISNVRFKLVESARVTFEVRDLTGRLIEVRELGNIAPGIHTETIDTNSLGAGMYTYSIIIDDAKLTRTMIVAGK
ncbi:MAG: T9SS type A sorting domain-containing protein [Flavobacteriales bacterium]